MKDLRDLRNEKDRLEGDIKRCLYNMSKNEPLSLGYQKTRKVLEHYEKRLQRVKNEMEIQRNNLIENAHRNAE